MPGAVKQKPAPVADLGKATQSQSQNQGPKTPSPAQKDLEGP